MFVHVPKCAGTAIRHAICEAVYGKKKFKQFGWNPWACRDAADALGEDENLLRRRLLAYHLATESNIFGSGHYPAPPRLVEHFRQPWYFITILRDPVARWQSEYIFNRHKDAEWGKVELGVQAYLETNHAHETATSFLRFFSDYTPGSQQRFEPLIQQAVGNLRRFHLVGRVEDMAGWETRFNKLFNTRIQLNRQNESPRPSAKASLMSPDIKGRIAELCEPDIEVYRRFFDS